MIGAAEAVSAFVGVEKPQFSVRSSAGVVLGTASPL